MPESLESIRTGPTTAEPAAATTLQILSALTQGYTGNFTVHLWDGSTWQPASGPAPFTLVLRHPGALRAMFWPFSKVGLGEAYIFDDFDIEGDIFAFTGWLRHLVAQAEGRGLWAKLRLLRGLLRLPNQKNPRDRSKAGRPTEGDHSQARDRESIHYTYDLPGELYRLFLDRNMQYTCSYFAHADEDLDTAQERKMDYICRKLRLKPGERFVDFGCGWGNLLVHAAKHYGVEAVGVTLSGEQAKCAERAIAEAGLEGRARIALCDYRDFSDAVPFDKASSVGMGEHIGNKNLPVFFAKIFSCLRPGGAYLHHSITLRPHTPYPRWTAFARKYVFPNGELQTILHVLASAAKVGFEVRDVESLREHYILTLEHWVRRLEANHEEVLKWTDEAGYRIFRLYMAGATMGFKSGVYNLNQCLVVKPDAGRSGLPLTRTDWYAQRIHGEVSGQGARTS
jgi:cyclopropane-fatty-acyl-phospholipid synthase